MARKDLLQPLVVAVFLATACGGGAGASSSHLSAVSPAASTVSVLAGDITADGVATLAVSVTVRNAAGEPLPGVTVQFTSTGTSNQFDPVSVTTGTTGVAISALTSTRAEVKTVSAIAGGTALGETRLVRFVAGPPDQAGSSLTATPASTAADGTQSTLVARVADRHGNAIAGAVVVFLASQGQAAFSQPTQPTGADGVATGTVSSLSSGACSVTAMVGATIVAAATVSFTEAPVSSTLSNISPAEADAAAVPGDGTAVAVRVLDTAQRALAGQVVRLQHSGGADVSPASAPTDVDGNASFRVTSRIPTSGVLSATVNPGVGEVVLAARPALAFHAVYTVGGPVAGLDADGLVLALSGQPDVVVSAGSSSYQFPVALPLGALYSVSVKTEPAHLLCTTVSATGVVGAADVVSAGVQCSPATWKAMAGGFGHTLAIKSDGTLWAWGRNIYGEVGKGAESPSEGPTRLGAGFAEIAAGGYHSAAIKTDGTLWSWGFNTYGQVGDGTRVQRAAPVQIGADRDWVAVAAGYEHTLAIKRDGTLWAWGANDRGQVGEGTYQQQDAPVKIGTGFVSATGGMQHSAGLKADGSLWVWGGNAYGQVTGTSIYSKMVPTQIAAGFLSVSAGAYSNVALKADGTLWSRGYNGSGQLGDGSTIQRTSMVQIGVDPVS